MFLNGGVEGEEADDVVAVLGKEVIEANVPSCDGHDGMACQLLL